MWAYQGDDNAVAMVAWGARAPPGGVRHIVHDGRDRRRDRATRHTDTERRRDRDPHRGTQPTRDRARATPAPPATARPANTPAPSPSAAPANPTAAPAGALKVVEQGFGQNERSIGFAFVVENTDPKTAVDFSQYRVSAFDAAGTVMRTDASYIPVIFPGQRMGIAGEFALAQDARIVNVDFTLTPGRARPFDGPSPLVTENVTFQGNPTTGTIVTGIIKNMYPQDLRNVQVYAIAYDARGVIIGGGRKLVDRVPGAGGQAPADVTVTVIGIPARVELYATFAY